MKQYWPMAIALDTNGEPIQLHTYDSCLSVEACEKVFVLWQDAHHYTLLSTWIDTFDSNGTRMRPIRHKSYVNAIGQVRKI